MLPKNHEHTSTVIWLHGLGDSAHGFKDLFQDGDISVPPGTKVIIPTAPEQSVKILDDKEEFSWFDIKSLAKPIDFEYKTAKFLEGNFDQTQLDKSVQYVIKIIKDEIKLLGDAQRVFLGGFS